MLVRLPVFLTQPEVVDRLIDAIQRGNYVEVACKQAGISKSTYYKWRRLAKDPNADEAYRSLIDRTDEAEAIAETRCVDILSGCDDPKIVLEFMARRWPDRWGRMPRLTPEQAIQACATSLGLTLDEFVDAAGTNEDFVKEAQSLDD